MRTNMLISNQKPCSRIHFWSKTSHWQWYYSGVDVFVVHIRTHNPCRIIRDLCALQGYTPGDLIHDNMILPVDDAYQ